MLLHFVRIRHSALTPFSEACLFHGGRSDTFEREEREVSWPEGGWNSGTSFLLFPFSCEWEELRYLPSSPFLLSLLLIPRIEAVKKDKANKTKKEEQKGGGGDGRRERELF